MVPWPLFELEHEFELELVAAAGRDLDTFAGLEFRKTWETAKADMVFDLLPYTTFRGMASGRVVIKRSIRFQSEAEGFVNKHPSYLR